MGKCESMELEVWDKTPSENARRPPGEIENRFPSPLGEGTSNPSACRTSASTPRPLKPKIFKEVGCVAAAVASNKSKQIKLI